MKHTHICWKYNICQKLSINIDYQVATCGAWGRPLRGLGRPHREGHRRRRGAWGRPRGLGGMALGGDIYMYIA